MGTTAAVRRHGINWRRGFRVFLTVAAGAGLAYLLLVAFVLAAIKCGDSCGEADAEHWRWTVQFGLAAVGSLLGVVALALGFTSRTRAYRILLIVSLGCVLAWLTWVVGFGEF